MVLSINMDLLMLRLESQAFQRICDTTQNANRNTGVSGISFSDILSGVMSENSIAPTGVSANTETTEAGGMKISDDMVRFIENHEGFSATAYRGVDYWNETIGYGHVIEPGENITSLTPAGADKLLRGDLKIFEDSVNKEFKGVKLTQGQFDALTSFAYGLGANIWSKTPKLTADIKAGAPADVIKADFQNCAYCGGKFVQGLLNRRTDEWQVYASGTYPVLK